MTLQIDPEAGVQKVALNTWSAEAVPISETSSSEKYDTNTANNIFSDPKTLEHYTALYDKAKYECRHLLDPTLEWTREEEKKLVRKLDWHVCTWAVWMCSSDEH